MPNITLSIDEELLKAGRTYAQQHNTSLNALIRQLLARTVGGANPDWLAKCFELADKAGANSRGEKWNREDLYE